jgi:hypothetical protein
MFGSRSYMTEEQVAALVQPLTERMGQLEELVAQQTAALKALGAEMEALRETVGQLQASPAGLSVASASDEMMPAECAGKMPATSSTWFFSTPSPEGTFSDGATQETVGKSIYRLHTDDGVNGRFVMLSSPDAIATAMISVSQFVKPVCRIEGNTRRQPQHIETLEEGVAQLSGDVWKVVRKATVQFV